MSRKSAVTPPTAEAPDKSETPPMSWRLLDLENMELTRKIESRLRGRKIDTYGQLADTLGGGEKFNLRQHEIDNLWLCINAAREADGETEPEPEGYAEAWTTLPIDRDDLEDTVEDDGTETDADPDDVEATDSESETAREPAILDLPLEPSAGVPADFLDRWPEAAPGPDRAAVYDPAVPLVKIVPSPTNPRKTFDPVELNELAKSIAEKGVPEPILPRPVRPRDRGDHGRRVRGGEKWGVPGQADPLPSEDMQPAAPQPSGVGAMAEKLLLAAFDGIRETDMTDIVKGVVEKAKAGDVEALKFVMDFIGKAGSPPPPPRVVAVRASAAAETPDDDDRETPLPTRVPDPPHVQTMRRFAAKILAADGETDTAGLAGQLGMGDAELCHVMKHEWFAVGNGYWSLTPAGRRSQRLKEDPKLGDRR